VIARKAFGFKKMGETFHGALDFNAGEGSISMTMTTTMMGMGTTMMGSMTTMSRTDTPTRKKWETG
jgi:hypothetical protein